MMVKKYTYFLSNTKFKICILIMRQINQSLKSIVTLIIPFQDFLNSVELL